MTRGITKAAAIRLGEDALSIQRSSFMRKMALGQVRHKPCSRACVNHELRAN